VPAHVIPTIVADYSMRCIRQNTLSGHCGLVVAYVLVIAGGCGGNPNVISESKSARLSGEKYLDAFYDSADLPVAVIVSELPATEVATSISGATLGISTSKGTNRTLSVLDSGITVVAIGSHGTVEVVEQDRSQQERLAELLSVFRVTDSDDSRWTQLLSDIVEATK